MNDFKKKFMIGLAAGSVAAAFVVLYAVIVANVLTRG